MLRICKVHHIFTISLQAVVCSTNSTAIACFLLVNNNQSETGVIETSTFVPEPPIILGQAVLNGRGQVCHSLPA